MTVADYADTPFARVPRLHHKDALAGPSSAGFARRNLVGLMGVMMSGGGADSPLPSGYRQTTATRIDTSRGYDIGFSVNVKWQQAAKIEMKFSVVTTRYYMMCASVSSRTSWTPGQPYIAVDKNSNTNILARPAGLSSDSLSISVDGSINDILINVTSASAYYIGFASWSDSTFSKTADWYGAIVYDANGGKLCDLIPCVRSSDGKAGFWDKVNNEFVRSNIGVDYVAVN